MPFTWAGCLDGSSIDLNKVDAFTVGQVQKHTSEGEPMFEESTVPDQPKKPVMQLCVFALIGQGNYPIRLVNNMPEAQLTIQSILGKLKKDYDTERGVVQVASVEEKNALKLG